MVEDRKAGGFSLRRWSQRKLAAKRDERTLESPRESEPLPGPRAVESREAVLPATVGSTTGVASPSVADHGIPASAADGRQPVYAVADAAPALPPIESLTFDSDFTAFMQPGVDENVRRGALRKLLRDPRFNVMDGLDVYIDDYSKPSPIEPEVVRTLWQARYLFDPPKTRVNAEGFVEDVPQHEAAVDPAAATGAEALPAPDAIAGVPMDLPPEDVSSVSAGGTAAPEDNLADGHSRDTRS